MRGVIRLLSMVLLLIGLLYIAMVVVIEMRLAASESELARLEAEVVWMDESALIERTQRQLHLDDFERKRISGWWHSVDESAAIAALELADGLVTVHCRSRSGEITRLDGTYSVHTESATPTIDFFLTSGGVSTFRRGVYEFGEGRLNLHLASPDAERPTAVNEPGMIGFRRVSVQR